MAMTLACLRKVLGDNLGSVLTPELAAQIEFAADDRAERSFEPGRFMPREYRNLVFQVESFRRILPELEPMHQAHYQETELHMLGVAMAPNYPYMAERERNGSLLQFTARDSAGKLVGNLRMYLATSMHTGQLVAEEDTFYLAPEVRKGFTASSFLRYAEEALSKIIGVQEIRANTKIINAASRLLDCRGYTHVANQYVKLFPKD